jgi:hypothetical protein
MRTVNHRDRPPNAKFSPTSVFDLYFWDMCSCPRQPNPEVLHQPRLLFQWLARPALRYSSLRPQRPLRLSVIFSLLLKPAGSKTHRLISAHRPATSASAPLLYSPPGSHRNPHRLRQSHSSQRPRSRPPATLIAKRRPRPIGTNKKFVSPPRALPASFLIQSLRSARLTPPISAHAHHPAPQRSCLPHACHIKRRSQLIHSATSVGCPIPIPIRNPANP